MAETPIETPTTATQKRPLEEPSSPNGPNDQPEAKRPALDKVLKEDGTAVAEPVVASDSANGDLPQADAAKHEDPALEQPAANEVKVESSATDKQGDTVVPDAPENGANAAAAASQTEQSPVISNGQPDMRADSQAPMPYHQQDETAWLHVRAIISSAEAATVIGKGGENVSQIRRLAGAKCTVSEYSRGAVERILTVSGHVDAVAKVMHPECTYEEGIANNN